MFDDIDDFPSRVGIGDKSLISHTPKFAEGFNKLFDHFIINIWSVLFQELYFAFEARIIDGMCAEKVPECAKEVITQKWKSGTIGKYYHSEIGMHSYPIIYFTV